MLSFGKSAETTWDLMDRWIRESEKILLKKLSRNDTSWADDQSKHQAGVYIPRAIRESGFFPQLVARDDKPHIYQASCTTFWPQTGEQKSSGLRHYSNKGPETHLTVVPHDLFRGLSPASWLFGGRLRQPVGESHYWFVVIDSTSDDAEFLETALDIKSDFHHDILEPEALLRTQALDKDLSEALIERISDAIRRGTLLDLRESLSQLPSTATLAKEARAEFFKTERMASLNPFVIECPGDALMRISRDYEYKIFKKYELQRRAVEVVYALATHTNLATSVVLGFSDLDRIFLSASQQRKTRAGRSFEHHLASALKDGNIAFEEQAILGGRRPDFVLPDRRSMQRPSCRAYDDAVIISAKTTLRERWKQITHERFNCAIFLATVDDRVSSQSLADMRDMDITLVVPESLKSSKETNYAASSNVISFRDFFHYELKTRRPSLILTGETAKKGTAPEELGRLPLP